MADDLKIRVGADASEATKALASLEESFAKAEQAVARFGEQAQSGGKGAVRSLAQATVEVKNLEAAIDAIRASGGVVPPEQLQRLEAMQTQLAENTKTLGKYRAAMEDAKDAAARSTVQAGEFEGQVNSLDDILRDHLGTLGKMVTQLFLAKAAFEEAYRGTRTLIDGLKEFGVDVDALVRGPLQMLTDWAVGAPAELGKIATAIDATNKSLEMAKSIRADFVRGLEEERTALAATTEAIAAQVAVEQKVGEVQVATREWITKTIEGYTELGDTVPPKLQAIADSLGIVTKADQEHAKAAEESAAKVKKAYDDEVRALEAQIKQLQSLHEQKAKQAEEAAKRQLAAQEKLDQAMENAAAGPNAGQISQLQKKVDELNQLDFLTPDQLKELYDAQDAITELTYGIKAETDATRLLNEEQEAYNEFLLERGRATEAAAAENSAWWETQRALESATQDATEAISGQKVVWDEATRSMKTTGEQVEETLAQTTESVKKFGEEAAKANEKATEPLKDLAENSKDARTELERIKVLLVDIKKLAAEVTLGGSA